MHTSETVKIVKEAAQQLSTFLIEAVPDERLPKSDVVFVLGHIDPRLAVHAAELHKKGLAPYVLISGGFGPRTKLPHPFKTEADYYQHIMVERGTPSKKILLENAAKNTLQNVIWGVERFRTLVGGYPKNLIAVAMPLLLKRSIATFQKQYPEIRVFGSAFQPTDPEEWVNSAWSRRAVGEIDRLNAYAEKGDIAQVEIPMDVRMAAAYINTHDDNEP